MLGTRTERGSSLSFNYGSSFDRVVRRSGEIRLDPILATQLRPEDKSSMICVSK